MNRSTIFLLVLSLGFYFAMTAPVRAQLPPGEQAESETLTRGPLHEAFAEQVNYDPKPGITIRKAVPEPIEEVPPDVKPEGNNVEWISGYWAWDDDREDFLWVSGVWRDVPPDRRWVPGYWAEVSEGYQWIAGFWNLIDANEVEYLPYPPASLERGPTSPLPSTSHYWVSGCWQYQNQRYAWRPGFWSGYRQDWCWTPAHYNWTPRGAIYIRGYWDYPLARRGVLFAPVYFPHYPNHQRRYQYSPSVVINLGLVLNHLFVQPGYHHYYWGDYYGDRYRRAGYQPNFAFHGRGGYDPLFNYHDTQQRRQGIDYSSRMRDWHNSREQHADERPPRTWNQQQDLVARVGNDTSASRQLLARPLRDLIKDGNSEVRFRQVDSDQRQVLGQRSTALRDLSQRRNSTEANARTEARSRDDVTKQFDVGRTPAKLQLLPDVASDRERGDQGRGDRVNFEQAEPRPNGSSDAPTRRSTERTTPDRDASPERNARGPQFKPSDLTDSPRMGVDGDRGPQRLPRDIDRPESAPKQDVAQPNRTPQDRSRPTPPTQPNPQLDSGTPRPNERPTPERDASPERNSRGPQFKPSDLTDSPRTGVGADRGPQRSPPAIDRSESAPKQQVPQPNRTPPDRSPRTPERSSVAPPAQPNRQLDLPKAINQQRPPRQVETPAPQPPTQSVLPNRRPVDNSSRVQPAPRLQAQPGIGRQLPDRSRNNASTPQVAPRVRSAEPAPQRPPRVESQGRSGGSPNVPKARSSGGSQRPAPASRGKDDDGRSKR